MATPRVDPLASVGTPRAGRSVAYQEASNPPGDSRASRTAFDLQPLGSVEPGTGTGLRGSTIGKATGVENSGQRRASSARTTKTRTTATRPGTVEPGAGTGPAIGVGHPGQDRDSYRQGQHHTCNGSGYAPAGRVDPLSSLPGWDCRRVGLAGLAPALAFRRASSRGSSVPSERPRLAGPAQRRGSGRDGSGEVVGGLADRQDSATKKPTSGPACKVRCGFDAAATSDLSGPTLFHCFEYS